MSEQASKVSGVVQIDSSPAERTVRAYGYESQEHAIDGETVTLSRSLGHATSDPATGEYTIDLLGGYDKQVFVVAFDDYGVDFSPELSVAVGDRIHPGTPNGYVWECVGAGTLPAEEPAWIVDTETAQLYGTASMITRPFYRSMVHGPVTPEVIQIEEPEPLPEIIGEPYGGGFYAGDIEIEGGLYKLIVSDGAADTSGLPWVSPVVDWPAASDPVDGLANTLTMEGDARFEAAYYVLGYAGGGFTDWYLPARDELTVLYNNLGPNNSPPSGFESGGTHAFAPGNGDYYWTSTQYGASNIYVLRFRDGNLSRWMDPDSTSMRVRPIRRVAVT